MRTSQFSELARLGQTAVVQPPWAEAYSGRIVALTNPRYGAHVRASDGRGIRYTDCTWITALQDSDGQLGSDGRVWDGHHRICIAIKRGIPVVNVEL